MNGWKYDWVGELPRHVYDVCVAMLNREGDKLSAATTAADMPDDVDAEGL